MFTAQHNQPQRALDFFLLTTFRFNAAALFAIGEDNIEVFVKGKKDPNKGSLLINCDFHFPVDKLGEFGGGLGVDYCCGGREYKEYGE